MKSLKELEEIRKKTLLNVNQRREGDKIRVVVGMATCGIAAGARPVLLAIVEEVEKLGLENVVVAQTGCIGACKLEPIVEVIVPGQDKITYVEMNEDKARRIVNEHIKQGIIVNEYKIEDF